MTTALMALLVVNFVYVIILPKIFFKKDGKLNFMWWVTGLPYGLAPLGVVLQGFDILPGQIFLGTSEVQQILSVLVSSVSISLISYTVGTHRIPLALWHQENDAPKQIVTWGAYKKIRHPFYCSFLVALFAALVAAPNLLTIYSLIHGFLILNMTAAKEEAKLSSSDYGDEYKEYLKNTGRFFPRI